MRQLSFLLILLTITALFSCANQGVPSGGEKDEEPPKILKTIPSNYSTNFDKKKITLSFDEFVALKNTKKNFVISPPQKKQPKIRLREKAIVIDIRDSLFPNTTYSLDFGQAIVDNNEGNPLGNYRYIFSTGTNIDSLSLAGYVKDSKMNSPSPNLIVGLYPEEDILDSIYNRLPDYVAATDSIGFFMFTNIANKSFRIVTFLDANTNNMLDEGEDVGFLKETITPLKTIGTKADSLKMDQYTVFHNTNIQLKLCKPISHIQYLKDYKRLSRNKLLFVFNAPLKDSLNVKFTNVAKKPDFIIEDLRNQDSLFYWITDSTIAKRDTLIAELEFLKTNTKEKKLELSTDTVKLLFKTKKKRKERKADKTKNKDIDFTKIKITAETPYDYFSPIILDFETPMTEDLKSKISLYQPIDSTTIKEQDFTLTRDSILPYRRFYIKANLKPDTSYELKIDSATIHTIDNKFNNTFKSRFTTQKENYYGKIFVSVDESNPSIVIELLDKNEKSKIVATEKASDSGKFIFKNIPKGIYNLRAYWDTNNNGKWDDGNFLKETYPEPVKVFNKDIELPANWEINVSWTLKK